MSSVSSVNNELLSTFEIPQSLIPNRNGQRSVLLFKLARCLKKHFADARSQDLKPIIQRWHEMALPFIATKPFEETWIDFCYGFDRVKYPEGEISRRVLENLPALPPDMNGVGEFGESGDRLLQICLGLSKFTDDGVFFLPCRKAGEWLGRSHTDAGRLIQVLVKFNILKIITPATKRDAARYLLV